YMFGETNSSEYTLALTPEVRAVTKFKSIPSSADKEFYGTELLKPVFGCSVFENTQAPNLPGSPTFSSRFM
ncbi:hypothetical protein HDU97_008660, partial [Phlyctochytrium planicorne]